MAMRDIIKKAIEEGGATKESLLELTGTTEKGLASQFTYLRMMGTCPMKQEDGTWKIVTTEEWEAHRSSGSGVAGKILTPAERVEKAEKRSKRATSAYDNAMARVEANPDDRLLALKFTKAEAELEIAEIELGKAEMLLATEAPPEEPPEEPEEVEGSEVEEEISEEDSAELEATEEEDLQ
jgi:hypothetical protein